MAVNHSKSPGNFRFILLVHEPARARTLKETGAEAHMKRTTIEPPMEFASRMQVSYRKHDPMRRFEATPHAINLMVMGRVIRLETNSAILIEHVAKLFTRYSGNADRSPQFLWRMIVQSDIMCRPPWPVRSTFSDDGMRFAQFGQKNFVAVDIGAREAIAFISECLFRDAQGFISPFIDTLFYMSAAPLALTPFASACVRLANSGLLVLGEPNQGKTTASYIATRDGLRIHADQSVFLEFVDNRVRAWGDFVPLAFRPETLQFLPELRSQVIPFSYCDFSFQYLPKPEQELAGSGFVMPVCCVVLERGKASRPRLEKLEGSALLRLLVRHIAFKDDLQFEEQTQRMVAELAHLPSYSLAYGNDPADAVPFFHQLLNRYRTYIPDSTAE